MANKNMSQANLNHHADQMNPNNYQYRLRMDNRSNQLNPNNKLYQGEKNNPLILLGNRKSRFLLPDGSLSNASTPNTF